MGIASILLLLAVSEIIAQGCKNKDMQCSVSKFDQNTNWSSAASVYDFNANDIVNENVPLEKYRSHVLIIVNVASNCGLTDTNYKQLQKLYNKYNEKKGLRILAFPSNQFIQEPGTSEEIQNFVKQYNVTFDMFEKIDVNGENAHPLWKWLQTQKGELITNDMIKWNFTKFIIDKEGKVVERFPPSTSPLEMEETLKKYF